MKLFSRLIQTSHRLMHASHKLLRVVAIIPILIIHSPSYAEVDIDNHGDADRAEFSQAELDQILAPIALYPDTVLSQVLIAATYPIEVVQADRWASTHTNIKGADAVAKVEDKDWDPSVKALVAFPDILQRMSDDVDWTQKLGDAFLGDEARVMDSIQSLRKKAYTSGSLNKVQHLKVQRDDDEIIIEPAEERVVYVPVYDTRVVYGNWWWPDYPPVYWHQPTSYIQVSGFYWGPSIYIGPTFFYSSCLWRERHVVVVDRYRGAGPRPVFYTSRSIVTYRDARAWQHEPIHRRGVAYYNNDLRDRYGSHRESYRDAHVYRDQRREQQSPMHMQPRNDANRDTNRIDRDDRSRPVTVDRSEQLRERMNHRNGDSALQHSDRNVSGDASRDGAHDVNRDANRADNNDARITRVPEQNENRNNVEAHTRIGPRASSPRTTETNNLGATRPTLNAPERSVPERVRPERAQPERSQPQPSNEIRNTEQNDARGRAPRDREMHNNGRNLRQLPNQRIEQRQERQDSQPQRDKSDDNNKRQNRI